MPRHMGPPGPKIGGGGGGGGGVTCARPCFATTYHLDGGEGGVMNWPTILNPFSMYDVLH